MSLQADIRTFIDNSPVHIQMKKGRKSGGSNKSTYRYKIINLENNSYKLYTSYNAIAKEYNKSLMTVQAWRNYPEKIKNQFNIKLELVNIPSVEKQIIKDTYEQEPQQEAEPEAEQEPEQEPKCTETENYIKKYRELEAKYNKLKTLYLAQL